MSMRALASIIVGVAMAASAATSYATQITGGFSVSGGVAPLPAGAINLATGLDFAPSGGASSCTGDIEIAVGGSGATCNGATSITLDIPLGSLIGTGAVSLPLNILNWITLSLGGVSFDLLTVTEIGRHATGIPDIDLQGTGTMHATGFTATSGFFHLTAQGTTGTFSFSSTQISTAVPEPTTVALLGLALVGLGFSRRGKQR